MIHTMLPRWKINLMIAAGLLVIWGLPIAAYLYIVFKSS